jgi:hypothetical protein
VKGASQSAVERLRAELADLEAAAQVLRDSLAGESARLLAQVALHAADHQRLIELAAGGESHRLAADDLAAQLVAVLPGVESASAKVAGAIAVLQNTEAAIALRQQELERLLAEATALAAAASPRKLH